MTILATGWLAIHKVMKNNNCCLCIKKIQEEVGIKYYYAMDTPFQEGEWEEIPLTLYHELETFANSRS